MPEPWLAERAALEEAEVFTFSGPWEKIFDEFWLDTCTLRAAPGPSSCEREKEDFPPGGACRRVLERSMLGEVKIQEAN